MCTEFVLHFQEMNLATVWHISMTAFNTQSYLNMTSKFSKQYGRLSGYFKEMLRIVSAHNALAGKNIIKVRFYSANVIVLFLLEKFRFLKQYSKTVHVYEKNSYVILDNYRIITP